MTFQTFLPDLLWEPLVRTSLLEDLGTGADVTTQALLDPKRPLQAIFRARKKGVLAGLQGAELAFTLLDKSVRFLPQKNDGEQIIAGDVLAVVEGGAGAVLAGERTALNLLSHLSGIATATREIVDAVDGTNVRICCTRKTLPGMKAVQKYAVRAGGGSSHRYRLDDAILIKDNHLALCGGVSAALAKARSRAGHLMKIELEVDTLEQLEEALSAGGADAYLLDNMSPDQLRQAVRLIAGRGIAEASGGITPETARPIAETGVDIISLGWLTHTVRALDIGLDIEG
ncbi:carboxylating nicotinate-nucleotide diphosphorylase [Gluconobacter thailandicus]|uniref:Probable nicotinate-nucleotide pyrophosphorylase [carboxylating] n=1 Tax=Gluconobacter thailandicus TaxID=257438 RepID=A0AAP9EU03_GLUTH|nr:carboxylating nicotinate-nucleotide diphosphorylase [Gluconobacter thailandicus]KXV33861.1 nicotinate-nucleotide pyrophosphorylase [Gluconobacter thailandicus]QEH97139.1 carboxylating nicotinate-nucleotide diphosphorylase [Gluconobacter thailandicus]